MLAFLGLNAVVRIGLLLFNGEFELLLPWFSLPILVIGAVFDLAAAAWWLPADLVAQLLPGAWAWCRWLPGRVPGLGGRVCVCVAGRSVFVIRGPGSQTPGPRCLVRDPWPACLAAWSVATGPRALARK